MANPDGIFWVATSEAELQACRRENHAILHGRAAVDGWTFRDTYPTNIAYSTAEYLRRTEGVEAMVLDPAVNGSGVIMRRHATVVSKPRTW